jgi:hypothetical protein
MMVLLSLGALSLWAIIAAAVVTANDGYRQLPTNRLLLP